MSKPIDQNKRTLQPVHGCLSLLDVPSWADHARPDLNGFAIASGRNNICFGTVADGVIQWGEEPADPFDVRVFDRVQEYLYYPESGKWKCRWIQEASCDNAMTFDEVFLVWGEATGPKATFTRFTEPGRGIQMAVPASGPLATVTCRSYLLADDTGRLTPAYWRFVDISYQEKREVSK